MNLSRLGMGEDAAVRKTEFNDVSSVGETHTTVPPKSEIPNRFVLQLSSVAEEPSEHDDEDVHYDVETFPSVHATCYVITSLPLVLMIFI